MRSSIFSQMSSSSDHHHVVFQLIKAFVSQFVDVELPFRSHHSPLRFQSLPQVIRIKPVLGFHTSSSSIEGVSQSSHDVRVLSRLLVNLWSFDELFERAMRDIGSNCFHLPR